MQDTMKNQLRAYLRATSRPPSESGQPGNWVFGFFMPDDGQDAGILANEHLELRADAFVVDRLLGSIGMVHCVGGPTGDVVPSAAQVRGWVEDAAHLRHLMAMKTESRRVIGAVPHEFVPTVELVFIASAEAGMIMDRIREELLWLKAHTEVLHGIGINLAIVGSPTKDGYDPRIRRGFSWLLTDVRAWLQASLRVEREGAQQPGAAQEEHRSLRQISAIDFRIRGTRRWTLERPEETGSNSPPLLHLLHGPNGSGKSTLAEAFEFWVTGTSTRLRRGGSGLGPLVYARGTSQDNPKVARVAVAVGGRNQKVESRDRVASKQDVPATGDGGPFAAIHGPALRFDEAVSHTLLRSSETERMAFWLKAYFSRHLETQEEEARARRKLRAALDALRISVGAEAAEEAVRPLLGDDPKGAGLDWKALLMMPALELGSDAWSLLEDADREQVARLEAKGEEGKSALERVLRRWWEVVTKAEMALTEDFGRYLEHLGDFVIAGQVSAVLDDRDPEDVYATWLENVARVDLLESALKLGETMRAWSPPQGDILGRVRIDGDLDDVAQARMEAARARDEAWTWLSKHRESSRGRAEGSRGGAGATLPDLGLLEAAAKAGAFGNLLTAERFLGIRAAIQSGKPQVEGPLRAGAERGWTRPLIEARASMLRMKGWIAQRAGMSASGVVRSDWEKDVVRHLGDLAEAVRELQGVNRKDADHFKQITQKLPEALQELVELMTPASWAYERMDVKVGLDVAEVGSATLTMQARGMELEDVLNTAEKNAVALAMHLLCAPKADNPYRITFLDDPFQNMDELTVTITARALSKLLRLMGSTGKYPGWEFVLLLHGADDCERVVQEVPSVFYRIPWNSPDGAAGTGAGASAGDVEHVRGVGSTRADLFDCVKFMGLAWDEKVGLVDPKAEAKAKEPKAKPSA